MDAELAATERAISDLVERTDTRYTAAVVEAAYEDHHHGRRHSVMADPLHAVNEALDEARARFGFRPLARPGEEERISDEIKAICAARGVHVLDVVWSDGEWGRRADVRIASHAEHVTTEGKPA